MQEPDSENPPANPYETQELLNQYLLFHYGSEDEQLPWEFGPREALHYPVRVVEQLLDRRSLPNNAMALEVGCSVGRSCFELAKYCISVLGIDYSEAFIRAADTLRHHGELDYEILETGSIRHTATARAPDGVDCNRLVFEQGDAQELRPELAEFDVVLAANLVCRLQRPRDFLRRLPQLLHSGGQLLLSTPLTWLEAFTAKSEWVGGTPDTGASIEVLGRELGDEFELIKTVELPFLIREHSRKYQWSVALGSAWRRL